MRSFTWRLFSVLLLTLAVFNFGCSPAKVDVPTEYVEFNSADGTFAIEFPKSWDIAGKSNKTRGIAWAKCSKGAIEVKVNASFTDGLVGELAGGLGNIGLGNGIEELTPVAKAQAHWKEYYEESYGQYEEDSGETITIPLGDTRVNRFEGMNGLTRVCGIRTTTLCRDRSVNLRAHCPKGQWEDFEPVFVKILESMKQGVEQ